MLSQDGVSVWRFASPARHKSIGRCSHYSRPCADLPFGSLLTLLLYYPLLNWSVYLGGLSNGDSIV